ncbi:MAG TPA: molybdate ABC transporter substrate-binding protein [Burkholderiales bacterium]
MRFLHIATLLTSISAVFLPWPTRAAELTVFAAVSVKDALDESIRGFEPAAGHRIVASYGASQALAKQIENGAPADLFISADLDWMDYAAERKLIVPGSRINLLGNRLVLIAPASSTASVQIAPTFPLSALLGSERLAIADPDSVPAGKYGKAALESLGVWASVSPKLARGENVRAALAFVSRGEAPFGIVYRSDATADRRVRVVGEFPASSHPPIVYPAALTAAGRSPIRAQFLSYLGSDVVRPIWEKHGFTLPVSRPR